MSGNNHHDAEFAFTVEGTKWETDYRRKTDDSSAYMKCTYITSGDSYTAHAIANNTGKHGGSTDVSNGYVYVFKKGTTKKIRNWTYERGFKYEAIFMSPNYGHKMHAEGLWSPDSI
ncbi:DUF2712 domain-containing protein [Agathobacter ruminis]|uniref:Uncharacterized protein n=1 Tax=Agathobacter ruminis TaxID=1712665 RepID=A0A2G3E4E8_9FIRM|nr:DUF2712 domain-containing protein [Agathobacter ruminis]MDC7301283.1 hypothetical protein [Agathobacter ruminis]PHU38148.1 hypothetical protein CSX02_04530 [Agathobacter ruminis]